MAGIWELDVFSEERLPSMYEALINGRVFAQRGGWTKRNATPDSWLHFLRSASLLEPEDLSERLPLPSGSSVAASLANRAYAGLPPGHESKFGRPGASLIIIVHKAAHVAHHHEASVSDTTTKCVWGTIRRGK